MAERPTHTPLSTNTSRTAPVLMIDNTVERKELIECAERRMLAAREMLFTLSSIEIERTIAEGRDLQSLTHAAYLLLADADDLYSAALRHTEVTHG
ncbi:hypothetical protein [Larsenimonas rhizosphaerae]|uniref:hypothetical protein n=1 Tax=Larsenimonas rhizosphaerae TaxID=2944682 RepID=UPI002033B224|nr:hypothetical protein [Larsenimonas rhizosphaerae]MCM2131967.1 hypothetical protein [Larsenimonas rhizosphaerae]